MTTDPNDYNYASATVPASALFVAADELLLVFPSVAATERFLKATDVENGVYPVAYGPNGEPYRIGCEGNRVIVERTGEPNRPDELRGLLLRDLEGTGHKLDSTTALEDAVSTVWAIESDFWQKHDPYGERFGARIPLWGCVAFVALVAVAIYFAFR